MIRRLLELLNLIKLCKPLLQQDNVRCCCCDKKLAFRVYQKAIAEGVVFGVNTQYKMKEFAVVLKEVQDELSR